VMEEHIDAGQSEPKELTEKLKTKKWEEKHPLQTRNYTTVHK